MTLPSRRLFLHSALAIGGGSFAFPSPASAIESISRTGRAPLRLSLAGYSCRDYLAGKLKPPMSYDDFIDSATAWGFDAVELTAYYFKDTTPEYLAHLKGRCTRLGLDISGGAVGNNFCEPNPDKLRTEIVKVKEWIEHYSPLGAKTIRIFAGSLAKGDTLEAARRRCVEAIEETCAYAGKYGIYLALENHGGITATVEQFLDLIKAVKSPWFGVNLDSGHFHSADPYADLARIAPYALNVQLKTEIQRAGHKTEPSDLSRLVGILRNANYRGYIVLEYEAAEDPKSAIPRYAEILRKLVH